MFASQRESWQRMTGASPVRLTTIEEALASMCSSPDQLLSVGDGLVFVVLAGRQDNETLTRVHGNLPP